MPPANLVLRLGLPDIGDDVLDFGSKLVFHIWDGCGSYGRNNSGETVQSCDSDSVGAAWSFYLSASLCCQSSSIARHTASHGTPPQAFQDQPCMMTV